MQRKPPDTRIYGEITELNREFLHLLAHFDRADQDPVFGLDPLLARRLASLDAMEREVIESTPCLLAEFRSLPGSDAAPAISDGAHRDDGWSAACRRDIEVFAASLLTYLWQVHSRTPPVNDLVHRPGQGRIQDAVRTEFLAHTPACRTCSYAVAGTVVRSSAFLAGSGWLGVDLRPESAGAVSPEHRATDRRPKLAPWHRARDHLPSLLGQAA